MPKHLVTLILVGLLAGCAPTPSKNATEDAQRFRDCRDCPEMVKVAPGEFYMGYDGGESERYEGPVRKIKIVRGFAAGRTEVTVGQFRRFVAATDYQAARGCYA